MPKPGAGVMTQVVVEPLATGLAQEIVPPLPETTPLTTTGNALTSVLALAELLPGVVSVVDAVMLAVAETVPVNVDATATTNVKFAVPLEGYDARLHVTVPLPPTAGAVKTGTDDIFAAEDAALRPQIERLVAEFPNLSTIAATLRRVHTASVNDWGALCWHRGNYFRSRNYPRFDILDRIGAGDSFVAGLVHGLLVANDPQKAVDLGAAHGALAMTTPGDTSMATLPEVEKLASGGDAKVQR